jgi:hypothetical protein
VLEVIVDTALLIVLALMWCLGVNHLIGEVRSGIAYAGFVDAVAVAKSQIPNKYHWAIVQHIVAVVLLSGFIVMLLIVLTTPN